MLIPEPDRTLPWTTVSAGICSWVKSSSLWEGDDKSILLAHKTGKEKDHVQEIDTYFSCFRIFSGDVFTMFYLQMILLLKTILLNGASHK